MNPTPLVFYRRYHTYQALLELHPTEELPDHACFSKAVLHVMQWIGNRISQTGEIGGEEIDGQEAPDGIGRVIPEADISFLQAYPRPEEYRSFDIRHVPDIHALDFADLKTAYVEEQGSWVFRLTESDNGKDERGQSGRTFITSVFVTEKGKAAVLGVRITCKEPWNNEKDAAVFRPAFIRNLSLDPEIIITEAGIPVEYAFSGEPIRVNGKSASDCRKLTEELICNENRQMPVVFIPAEAALDHGKEEQDPERGLSTLSKSMLGFCHIVVWDKSPNRLFGQFMGNEDFLEAATAGKVIFDRRIPARDLDYPTDYLNYDLKIIQNMGYQEPLRKAYRFDGFSFEAPWWDMTGMKIRMEEEQIPITVQEQIKLLDERIGQLEVNIAEKERDNDLIQRRNDELVRANETLNKRFNKAAGDLEKYEQASLQAGRERDAAQEELKKAKECVEELKKEAASGALKERQRLEPLLNLPPLSLSAKTEILDWIRQYYGDRLIIHPDAEKAFKKDSRDIDFGYFCRMIHYLSGWTLHRNEGMLAEESEDRQYDPFGCGFGMVYISPNSGAVMAHKEKYTIDISAYNPSRASVLINYHMRQGRGRDADMIRIYFYYDPDIKKTIIAYMPAHLPTAAQPH